jgi:hypothetical protein
MYSWYEKYGVFLRISTSSYEMLKDTVRIYVSMKRENCNNSISCYCISDDIVKDMTSSRMIIIPVHKFEFPLYRSCEMKEFKTCVFGAAWDGIMPTQTFMNIRSDCPHGL